MESSLQSLLLALDSSTWTRTTRNWSARRRTVENPTSRRRNQVEKARPADNSARRTSGSMNLNRRKVFLDGRRKPESGFTMRVRALQKLLPGADDSVGLDDLFSDAADYITYLQMQVNAMQAMVDVLSNSAS